MTKPFFALRIMFIRCNEAKTKGWTAVDMKKVWKAIFRPEKK